MTLDQWKPSTDVAINDQDRAVARLHDWATSADAAFQVASRLADSAFVPAQFKGKPVELTAAILAGLEVGLSPMTAMRSFDIISGQAAPRAITLRAVVQSHGHEMVLIESTTARCRMKGRRKGSDEWQTVTWTIERARDLGLAGKDQWKKQPTAMLLARATAELARLIASDAILGIGYAAEELSDGTTAAQPEPEQPTGVRRMSRKPAQEVTVAEVVADVETVEPTDEDEPVGEDEPVMLDPQSRLGKHMFGAIGKAGIPESDRLEFCSSAIGRVINSSKEMTEAEASQVIAAAEKLADQ